MKPGLFSLIALSAAFAILPGCGRDNPLGRKSVSGLVKLDGVPLEKGSIDLQPIDGGTQTGGLIEKGNYSIPEHLGATPGKYRVVIFDTYDTPPLPPGHMPGDDIPKAPKSKVPPEWNSKSTKEIEVKKEGPFRFDFAIETKKK